MTAVRPIFRIVLFTLIFSFPLPLYASSQETYIAASSLPPQLLPPPPAENSAAWKREISQVIEAQLSAKQPDLAAMREEQNMRLELMTEVLGPPFTREKQPETFAFLDKVFTNAITITEADKAFWRARRPYQTDHHVTLAIGPLDDSPTYPSGHTSESRVLAEVLGLLYPDQLGALRAKAAAIARHRIQAGVHYPDDIHGGEMLAMLMMGALMKSDEFQSDLAAAREEVARQP